MDAVIFANGVIKNTARARDVAERADLMMAADGGALHCLRLGLIPKLVVGDIDSLDDGSRQTLEASGVEFIVHPPNKDQTDLELALIDAATRGAEEITVLGAMGGRLDMTFANVLLLALPEFRDVRVELWHGDQSAWLVHPPGGTIRGRSGDLVSLIALGGDAQGVTTRDLQFSMLNEPLESGPARGISNVVTGANPRIELREGSVLVVHTPEAAADES